MDFTAPWHDLLQKVVSIHQPSRMRNDQDAHDKFSELLVGVGRAKFSVFKSVIIGARCTY